MGIAHPGGSELALHQFVKRKEPPEALARRATASIEEKKGFASKPGESCLNRLAVVIFDDQLQEEFRLKKIRKWICKSLSPMKSAQRLFI